MADPGLQTLLTGAVSAASMAQPSGDVTGEPGAAADGSVDAVLVSASADADVSLVVHASASATSGSLSASAPSGLRPRGLEDALSDALNSSFSDVPNDAEDPSSFVDASDSASVATVPPETSDTDDSDRLRS